MNNAPIWPRDSALLNTLLRNTYNAMSPSERTELLIKRDIEIDALKQKMESQPPHPAPSGAQESGE